MDAARLEFHDEEQIVGYQPALRPDLDRGKVDGYDASRLLLLDVARKFGNDGDGDIVAQLE
ncbi:MAG: hypothetical protein IID44_07510 [Planctomycetes bacterium]|nr:hypothetical protein [Planctomycetota bacterium]